MTSTATRRLSDLYTVSRDEDVYDPENPEVPFEITLVKLNNPDHQACVRKADAARAVTLAAAHDTESELYRAHAAIVLEQDDPRVLAAWLVMDEIGKRSISLEAELAADDEWSKDGYLDGLRESWVNGMKERFDLNPEDADAKRVFDELTRFNLGVMKRVAEEQDALVDLKIDKPIDQLHAECVKHLLKRHADEVWVETFRAASLYYMVRERDESFTPNRRPKYFESIDEVMVTPQKVLKQLITKAENLEVDSITGKDLSGNQGSSQPSEPTETGDSTSSGPENV